MIPVLLKKDWFHDDGFPISVARRDPQEPFGLHAHEFSEIVIVTGGKGLHVTGEDSYELRTGIAELTDTNTGIYWPASDTFGVVTGSVERWRISSAGEIVTVPSRVGLYTFATVPTASSYTGHQITISDRSYQSAYSDGTNWRFISDDAIIS